MTENKKRELLQQYIKGSISPKNRHALEREALDDIFLFEALEGYSKHMTSPDLPFYKAKPRAILPIRTFMTMAASFIILAGVAFLIKQNINPTINEKAIAHMEEESIVSEDQIATVGLLDLSERNINHPIEKNRQVGTSSANNNTFKKKENRLKSKIKNIENSAGLQHTNTTIASTEFSNETIQQQKEDIVFLDEASEQSPAAESAIISTKNQEQAPSVHEASQSQTAIYSPSDDVVYQQSSDSIEDIQTETRKQAAKAGRSIQLDEAKIDDQVINASNAKFKASDSDTLVKPVYIDLDISSKDTIQYENRRRSFPTGGWTSFNSDFEKLKEQGDCSDLSFTFKFQIQENGEIENLELTKVPSVDQTGSSTVLECLNKAKEFIQSNDKWETIPPNRKIKRTLTIKF